MPRLLSLLVFSLLTVAVFCLSKEREQEIKKLEVIVEGDTARFYAKAPSCPEGTMETERDGSPQYAYSDADCKLQCLKLLGDDYASHYNPAPNVALTSTRPQQYCTCCEPKVLKEVYCKLPIPSDRMWHRSYTGEPFIEQEKGKTREGQWVYSNACNSCSKDGLCTMMACANVWQDKLYRC